MNQKNKDFLKSLDGKPTSSPRKPESKPAPAKKYFDNAGGAQELDSPLFKGDPHKTDMAD